MMRPLRLALALLSRIPVPFPDAPAPVEWGWATLWFPVVGGLLGGALALAAGSLPFTPALTAALTLLLWVWFTGGLHLDGLADTADAWIGGMGDRSRMLAIMKDPACGPAGVVAITLLLLLKWAGLVELLGQKLSPWWLLWPPIVGRMAMLGMILTTPYLREEGMASHLWRHMPRRPAWLLLFWLVLGLGYAGRWFVVPLLAVALWLGRRALLVRLGGSTGDTLGATGELLELLTLMIIVVP